MSQDVSDIVVLAHAVGLVGFSPTENDQPASDNADARSADASGSWQNESHFALATRLGLPGFEPAAGGGQ